MTVRFNQFTLLCFLFIISITKTSTETLQQSLLRDIKPCKVDQFRCSNSQCIDGHGLCDGSRNCYDGSDERLCGEGIKTYMSASFVHRGKYLAQNWMHQLRRKEQPLRKWGADVRQDCSGPLPVG
ncbi:hypothetical protein AVEN_70397-1 [Araneus ventricosus]|uniref:Uncharacterized protein n=1 Tax=Araneus ventricosus TaxID=182803 RepID=A0A4Y2TK02_ARAVE|nr:hypothetical protein AVEN_70397-1 [Araneus ventricosus]